MTTVAFFNNKGGVGKTSLVYHLAWMLRELGRRVVAADLDPQANLTGMFLDETGLERLWRDGNQGTIDEGVAPLFEGTGDIVESPQIEEIGERIGLLMGDLALSRREAAGLRHHATLHPALQTRAGVRPMDRQDPVGVRAGSDAGRSTVRAGGAGPELSGAPEGLSFAHADGTGGEPSHVSVEAGPRRHRRASTGGP